MKDVFDINKKFTETEIINGNEIDVYDWKKEKLGNLLDFKNGLNYRVDDVGEKVSIVGVSEFKDSFQVNETGLPTVNVSSLPQDYLLQNGDLIFVRSNGNKELIGRVLFAKNISKNITHSGFTIRGRNKSDLVIDEYCAIFCSSNLIKRQLMTKGGGSNINNLNQKILSDIEILLPHPHEQQKIVEIHRLWSRAIELKEEVIRQKKKQKKGLMKKLLMGEVRLPGFTGEWKEVRLGDVLKERKEIGYSELELLAITSKKGIVRRAEMDIKDTSSEDKSKYKRILPNDIGYNTMRMWQGVSGVSRYEGIVSPAYTILKPTEKVDSNYIGCLFKFSGIINLFKRYSQGLVNDTLNLKYTNLKVIKVLVPLEVAEQKEISNVLLTCDRELEILEKGLEELKQQKKVLMQLLLTGKVRVKV